MRSSKRSNLEVAINIAATIIIIAVIVIIAKLLTTRKEAVYEEENISETETNTTTEEITEDMQNIIISNEVGISDKSIQNEISEDPTETMEDGATRYTQSDEPITSNGADKIQTERQGVIYLTFDDGPSSNITPKILDILKEENIKATFFVINFSDSNADLVKRAAEEGHTIGIHGYSHEYSKIYKSKEAFMENVYSLQNKIKEATGITTKYTRFPGGSSNTVSRKYCKGVMTELSQELMSKGFRYFDWNICAEDAGSAKSKQDVYKYATRGLSKNKQNMILMHDFTSNKKGLDALPDIIKYAKDNGYTFMPIDDNTPFFAQHINN